MNNATPHDANTPCPFVSRGGLKLQHALRSFAIDVAGLDCADLGCSTGGFTDCLLQYGAASVVSVDTGYGVLAYKLRIDPRVSVMERSNAMHLAPTRAVRLVAMDVSWTPMRHALPAAVRWLAPGGGGVLIALVKPHYERSSTDKSARGLVSEEQAEEITRRVIAQARIDHPTLSLVGATPSPIKGGGGKHKEGNPEWLVAWRSC